MVDYCKLYSRAGGLTTVVGGVKSENEIRGGIESE